MPSHEFLLCLGSTLFWVGRVRNLRAGLRSFPVGRFLTIYKVEGETAVILHVLPGIRDITALIE